MMGRVCQTGWFRRFSGISRRKAEDALNRVEMLPYRHRPIGQLSGGQQQRVFLARSLAQKRTFSFLMSRLLGSIKKTEGIIFNIFHELAQNGQNCASS